MSNFHPLEVVDRGSESQLQVGANLNKTSWRVKDYYAVMLSRFYSHRYTVTAIPPSSQGELTLTVRGSTLDVRI